MKKSEKKKKDKQVFPEIRARGKCERCGSFINLQCAHFYSRTYLKLRWYKDNLLCLCSGCHVNWAHKNPALFVEWFRKYRGDKIYNELKALRNDPTKYKWED